MIYHNEFRLDFIGIGAAKAGTTWVSYVLGKHPQIYFPTEKKEINYFNKLLAQDYKTENWDYKKGYDWYHEHFVKAAPGQVVGEFTPSYLGMENAPADIFKYNPNVKLFAIVRHPVDRSFSQYLFAKQNGIGSFKNFEEAVEKNPAKFVETSLYHKHLIPYLQYFPKENLKVFIYEDIQKDTRAFLKELFDFLGVDEFYPEGFDKKVNVGLQPKNQKLNNFIGKTKMFIHSNGLQFLLPLMEKTGVLGWVKGLKKKNLVKRDETQIETLSPEFRAKLLKVFEEDTTNLEKFLNRDLSEWRK